MRTLSDGLKTWSFRLRIVSYVFGFSGVIFMLAARSMEEPGRSIWAQRSFLLFGLMFCGFVTYYMLSILRMYRK